jgi:hypothetical protein
VFRREILTVEGIGEGVESDGEVDLGQCLHVELSGEVDQIECTGDYNTASSDPSLQLTMVAPPRESGVTSHCAF